MLFCKVWKSQTNLAGNIFRLRYIWFAGSDHGVTVVLILFAISDCKKQRKSAASVAPWLLTRLVRKKCIKTVCAGVCFDCTKCTGNNAIITMGFSSYCDV